MEKKLVKLSDVEIDKNNLQLNSGANLIRLEIALNDLSELNIERQSESVSRTEYYLRKSKIIKKLYSTE